VPQGCPPLRPSSRTFTESEALRQPLNPSNASLSRDLLEEESPDWVR